MAQSWQPAFNWSSSAVLEKLVQARFEQGRLLGLPSSFVHSYELADNRKAIYDDLKNSGLDIEKLKGWQASLFPTGYAGVKKIKVGELKKDVTELLGWWREAPVELDPVLRSGIAFFWFLVLSPFEAGNFEVSCALAEKALHEREKTSGRYYDISVQLEERRAEVLKRVEKVLNGDLTEWLLYYLDLYLQAVGAAYVIAEQDQKIERFWVGHSRLDLNSRQREVLNLMLIESIEMTNRSYVEICKTSRESAKRDLTELVKLGILKTGEKKGRSVSYIL